MDGFQYENNVLRFFPTGQGYVVKTGSSYQYVYTFRDHVGNVRLKYSDADQDGQIGTGEIIEESHYYPFGMRHSGYNSLPESGHRYRFNGQEWQDELGLNITAMDFRQYDNAIGRFNGMDVMAESMYSVTPYHFGFNNPVFWCDPSGLMPAFLQAIWDATKGTNSTWINVGHGFQQIVNGSAFVDFDGTFYEGLPEVTIITGGGSGSSESFLGQLQAHVYTHSPFYSHMLKSYYTSLSTINCHHTTTFSQGNGIDWSAFNLNDRQSGYLQYGGAMRSDFIGSSVGKNGVIYETVDNVFAPGADIKTKIQFLKYMMDTQTGLGIGYDLVESLLGNEPSINIRRFNYIGVRDTIWIHYGLRTVPFIRTEVKKALIINNDTIK